MDKRPDVAALQHENLAEGEDGFVVTTWKQYGLGKFAVVSYVECRSVFSCVVSRFSAIRLAVHCVMLGNPGVDLLIAVDRSCLCSESHCTGELGFLVTPVWWSPGYGTGSISSSNECSMRMSMFSILLGVSEALRGVIVDL